MQLTRRAEYALRAMLDLAEHAGSQPVMSKDIARRQDIPLKFLIQIIPDLKSSGLIHTVRGNGGGIYLRKNPQDITILDIIETIEGPLALNQCLLDGTNCPRSGICALHKVWDRAQQQMLSVLASTTLASLVQISPNAAVIDIGPERVCNEVEIEV